MTPYPAFVRDRPRREARQATPTHEERETGQSSQSYNIDRRNCGRGGCGLEALNISGMLKNRKLSRAVAAVGMYEFKR